MRTLLVLLLVLTACGGAPAGPTAQGVLDAFAAAGLTVTNVESVMDLPAGAPIPRTFKEHLVFALRDAMPEPERGQVYVCETKQNCDAIYGYFQSVGGGLATYLYQSPDGRVVVQLSDQTSDEAGQTILSVVNGLK